MNANDKKWVQLLRSRAAAMLSAADALEGSGEFSFEGALDPSVELLIEKDRNWIVNLRIRGATLIAAADAIEGTGVFSLLHTSIVSAPKNIGELQEWVAHFRKVAGLNPRKE